LRIVGVLGYPGIFSKLRSEQDFCCDALKDPKWIVIGTAIIQAGFNKILNQTGSCKIMIKIPLIARY
jgi:hypothetical protein